MNLHSVPKGRRQESRELTRRLCFHMLPSQRTYLDQIQDCWGRGKSTFHGFSGPVGSGKTLALANGALILAQANPGRVGVLSAPTYPMLRDATLVHLLNAINEYGFPFKLNRQEMRLFFPEWKSTILLRSLKEYDRLRGPNIAWFGIDELSYCREDAFLQLMARLRDPLANLRAGIAAWTPKGFDWVWKRFVSDEHPDNFFAIRARPFENSYLPPDYYPNLIKSYSPAWAQQEIYGDYLNIFSGRAYQQFDRAKNVWPAEKYATLLCQECKYTPNRPLLWSLDFNINPACSLMAQTVPRIKGERIAVTDIAGGRDGRVQLNILDELFLENRTTYEVCEEFLARIERLRERFEQQRIMVYVYGDPAGDSRHSNAQRTDWQIIREFFERHKDKMQASLRVRTAHPAVKDRVNCVNWACNSALSERRLIVHRRCKNLIADLEQVSWKSNPHGVMIADLDKDSDPMRTHLSDALGYLIEREWPMRRPGGLQPGYVA